METSAKNDEYISRTIWIFELIHIVFELEQIKAINNFIAPDILKIIVGHLYIAESSHK